ncbi:MAG: hypothetical protein HY782_16005 [Chloroflexi bacterium]|nr:hypothetical protein [Chloroflexota bacterium]
MSETPRVESFVLRFVADAPEHGAGDAARNWHGVVVHVQTNEEKTFTHFADAIAFIARYVPVGDSDSEGRRMKDDRGHLGEG